MATSKHIAPKQIALGLMSGTSLDGVDAAFLETDGQQIHRFGPSLCLDYTDAERQTLQHTTQEALTWQFQGAQPKSFKAAEIIIHEAHLRAVKQLCEAHPIWAKDLSLIGFHGQTVLHRSPKGSVRGRTLQLGDGQTLAKALGVPVCYDFRTADVEAGGQGAPLAPIYHQALIASSKLSLPTAVLNIGGVGNVTLMTEKGRIIASDTGPGNGPLDIWIEKNGLGKFDPDGRHSVAGMPNFHAVKTWLGRAFFQQPVPRSADRFDFDVLADMGDLSIEDGAATLAAFTVLAVTHTLNEMDETPKSLIVCGGGRHNKAMMWMLREELDAEVKTAEDVGWNSDAIEAQAFAYLAVRSKMKLPLSFPTTTGIAKPMTGGILALP